MDLKKNRGGCFRTGCLTVIVAMLVMVGVVSLLHYFGKKLPERFVLRLPVSGRIDDRPSDTAAFPFQSGSKSLSLEELMVVLDRARTDRRVDSVVLEVDGLTASSAKIQELRSSIDGVRKSGRKVVAFLRSPEDKDYMLAAACDSVVVQKGSWLLLDGLKAELFFFAEPLRKLGIGFQAAQWKKYKSGIEPFTRSSSSPEYREEVNALLDDTWADYIDYVSRRRAIGREDFAAIIDSLAVLSPEKALSLHLIDRVATFRQFEKGYEQKLGKPVRDLFVSGGDYLESTGGMKPGAIGERIAVINIAGPIVSSGGVGGMGDGEGIDVASLKQALETALDDRNVKAIVLRIDSPGGDALAAATMLELLDEARARKPMVASMSGVAASGGYMVALAADKIYVEPLTITGSIGVFALKPDVSGLLEKTGIHREVVTRGKFADAYTPFKSFDDSSFQKFVDTSGQIYRDFTGKVAARRKMTPEQVEAVAGGRVWTGRQALSVGLVDRIGGLNEAVGEARRIARMDSAKAPQLIYLPARKTWVDYLLAGEMAGLVNSISTRLARQSVQGILPAGQLPDVGVARLLLRSDSPQVLAVDPVEVIVR
ncbi:MAG: signal peptide peptidase SppA [Chlorobiaceae bacterium]|nr:signal peptide peptidase SppA [Chlorobiaceae bacterium]